jgi:hypothetical protein|tara:strand:- start:1685 stop:1927 length:243 start_codon:yes stop_codon:yes gene_type:complete
MIKKITNITLIHECDETNCHLDNQEQTKWIENILPKEKLGWNWKLTDIKVFDVTSPNSNNADSYISRVLDNKYENEESES